jgi:cysteine-S-conjugate beta-lyase
MQSCRVSAGFDDLSLEALRARRSAKWALYPEDVLPVWVAEMDFPLAGPVREVLQAAIDAGDVGYPHPAGLGEAFAGFARRRYGWAVEPESVMLLPDVMVGIAEVLRVVTEPGDGVVINPPVYSPFFSMIDEIGRRVVEVPLAEGERGWELDLDALEHAFAAGARAFLLCNPHNPTGRVLSRAELEAVAELSAQYRIAIVADEIHAPLTLARSAHVPFGALGEELAARAVTITSASKAWNLAGLKCAVLVPGSAAMTAELMHLPASLRYHAGHLGVLTAIAAFEFGETWLDELVAYLDGNRRLLRELLAAHLPDVRYVPPEAGYLAWLDCRKLPLGDDPAKAFLERGRVALSSGPSFGGQGRGFARLNFGTSGAIVAEAVERMAAAIQDEPNSNVHSS